MAISKSETKQIFAKHEVPNQEYQELIKFLQSSMEKSSGAKLKKIEKWLKKNKKYSINMYKTFPSPKELGVNVSISSLAYKISDEFGRKFDELVGKVLGKTTTLVFILTAGSPEQLEAFIKDHPGIIEEFKNTNTQKVNAAIIAATNEEHGAALIPILKKNGINLNHQDSTGKTAAHYAAIRDDVALLSALSVAGADFTIGEDLYLFNPKETAWINKKRNAMHWFEDNKKEIQLTNLFLHFCGGKLFGGIEEADAATLKRVKLISRRIEAIDAISKKNGYSALAAASAQGKCDLVEYLLDQGANPEKLCIVKDKSDKNLLVNPLSLAIMHYKKDSRIIKLLLDKGAKINSKLLIGSPLHVAVSTKNTAALKELLTHGRHRSEYDINRKNHQGLTPLALAVKDGSLAAVEILLAQPGIDKHCCSKLGESVFDLAIQAGSKPLLNYLLDHIEIFPSLRTMEAEG